MYLVQQEEGILGGANWTKSESHMICHSAVNGTYSPADLNLFTVILQNP